MSRNRRVVADQNVEMLVRKYLHVTKKCIVPSPLLTKWSPFFIPYCRQPLFFAALGTLSQCNQLLIILTLCS